MHHMLRALDAAGAALASADFGEVLDVLIAERENAGSLLAGLTKHAEVKSGGRNTRQASEMLQSLRLPHHAVVGILDGEWHLIQNTRQGQLIRALHNVVGKLDLRTIGVGEVWQAIDVFGGA